MKSNSCTAVSAELGLGLVGPEHTIVPLMARARRRWTSRWRPRSATLSSRPAPGV